MVSRSWGKEVTREKRGNREKQLRQKRRGGETTSPVTLSKGGLGKGKKTMQKEKGQGRGEGSQRRQRSSCEGHVPSREKKCPRFPQETGRKKKNFMSKLKGEKGGKKGRA